MAKRSGLGRGLSALIPLPESEPSVSASADRATGEAVIDLSEGVFREVDIDAISVNAYQPRHHIDDDNLDPLALSISELGVLQPLLVRPQEPGCYELIAGERRWRAARKAGLDRVPVIVREAQDVHSLEQALVENLHRQDLNPLDEAAAYRQLIDDFSMTHEQVGLRMGKSRTAISNLLRLLQLPPKVQKLLGEDRLNEGHARALLGTDDEAFRVQLAERTAREGLSVRNVEDAVRIRNELASPEAKLRSAVTRQHKPRHESAGALEWQERLATFFDTRVTVSMGPKRGKVVVEFADAGDLERICGLMTKESDLLPEKQ